MDWGLSFGGLSTYFWEAMYLFIIYLPVAKSVDVVSKVIETIGALWTAYKIQFINTQQGCFLIHFKTNSKLLQDFQASCYAIFV